MTTATFANTRKIADVYHSTDPNRTADLERQIAGLTKQLRQEQDKAQGRKPTSAALDIQKGIDALISQLPDTWADESDAVAWLLREMDRVIDFGNRADEKLAAAAKDGPHGLEFLGNLFTRSFLGRTVRNMQTALESSLEDPQYPRISEAIRVLLAAQDEILHHMSQTVRGNGNAVQDAIRATQLEACVDLLTEHIPTWLRHLRQMEDDLPPFHIEKEVGCECYHIYPGTGNAVDVADALVSVALVPAGADGTVLHGSRWVNTARKLLPDGPAHVWVSIRDGDHTELFGGNLCRTPNGDLLLVSI